jgi:SET domain-containing protein
MTEVKEAAERGLGLFAIKDFKKGERISRYVGDRMNKETLERIYGKGVTAPYVMQVGSDSFIDAASKSCPAAFANDAVDLRMLYSLLNKGVSKRKAYYKSTNKQARNARMTCYGGKVTLLATRPIKKGEEITISYGPQYWIINK